jgi:hypothetical protein
MPLPKLSPSELVEDLRELAKSAYMETWPNIPEDEGIEWDAADFIEQAERLLLEIMNDGGKFAEMARALLARAN